MAKRFLALVFAALSILPIYWILSGSFRETAAIFGDPWGLPSALRIENYQGAWATEGLGSGFGNTILASLLTLAILLPIGAMASYALSRFHFPLRRALSALFLVGMMFPNFLTVVPLYFQMIAIQAVNTLWGIVLVYVAYSLSFTVFVLSGFFEAIPRELEEAAELDGCTESSTFWRVMFPIARPGVIVVGIFNAIGLWNEYPLAVVLLTNPERRTLPLKVADMALSQQYQANWGFLFAGLVMSIAPVALIYLLLREKIHHAMLAGAIKG